MTEKKSAQIIQLFGQGNTAAGRDVVSTNKPKTVKLSIAGSHNVGVVGDHNNIHVNVNGGRAPRPRVVPGDSEVTNEQALEIRRLVLKVAEVSGASHQKVYGVLYDRFDATSYLMIKRVRYEECIAYLRRWLARYAVKHATNTEDLRKQLLKRIHAEARKRRGALDQIHSYVSGRFGTNSLADLAPGQLSEVIREFGL